MRETPLTVTQEVPMPKAGAFARRALRTALLFCLVLGCAPRDPSEPATQGPPEAQRPAQRAAPVAPAPELIGAPPASTSEQPLPSAADSAAAPPPVGPSPARAAKLLFPQDEAAARTALERCDGLPDDAIVCLLGEVYASDTDALALAVALWQRHRNLAGLEEAYSAVVGWRGAVSFRPALPIDKQRKHLRWTLAAFDEIDGVLRQLEAQAPLRFRWRGIELRFFETPERTTPSAYAHGWIVAYNLRGSLMRNQDAVTLTFFHEIFHLNDAAHGDWSLALEALHRDIIDGCRPEPGKPPGTRCLTPYAPGKTKVKGGTYYAFQEGNDVREYAAELATRYYEEQRQAAAGERVKRPFKCGPRENAEAWQMLVDAFFGGVDLVPGC